MPDASDNIDNAIIKAQELTIKIQAERIKLKHSRIKELTYLIQEISDKLKIDNFKDKEEADEFMARVKKVLEG